MRLQNIKIITEILLLSQLRLRVEGKKQHWYRTPRGLLGINVVVFVATFAALYSIIKFLPDELMVWLFPVAVQVLSSLPLITLSFMVLYGILFIIGESAQYASSEMVNYMPITTTEYVLGSSFSTIFMYLFILMAALGFSLAVALPLGFLAVWAVAALLSAFFMVVGGFIAEIIRALVNRVSSTFSKHGGRSAILTRALLILVVLVVSQLFFNPNFLFRVMQWFAPQIQTLWFVPLIWPSVVVVLMAAGNVVEAATYGLLTVAFGVILMGLGVFLRSRYWSPVPVTVKLGGGKAGNYGGRGILGSLGLSQAEVALVRKDARSLFRRKEMVRYLAIPIIITVVMFLNFTFATPETDPLELFYGVGGTCLMGGGMFGLFISMISMGQEGTAIWNLYTAPLTTRSLFKAKLVVPVLISILPAAALPVLFSLALGFTFMSSIILVSTSLILCILAVFIGSNLSPRYMDLEEKPRSSYIRGTGIFLGFLELAAVGFVTLLPLLFYAFWKETALAVGVTSTIALMITLAIAIIFIMVLYRLAYHSMQKVSIE